MVSQSTAVLALRAWRSVVGAIGQRIFQLRNKQERLEYSLEAFCTSNITTLERQMQGCE